MSQIEPIDHTHAEDLESWVESANSPGTDFPIQNLPFGRFRLRDSDSWQIGVAIGDQVLDLRATGLITQDDMQYLLAMPPEKRRALRHLISAGLAKNSVLMQSWSKHLYDQSMVTIGMPCDIRDYTDFYIGIHHARGVGKLFRPENPLLPNYKHVPIAYHGRASTIIPSGTPFIRPSGQVMLPDQDNPVFSPTSKLDFELEMGVVIGQSNPQGHPISIQNAENHIFGLTLLNDWSARDIQAWEYQPLGPFLSKNFASTVSPWIVTMEALSPFRQHFSRPNDDPLPLPYLDSIDNRLHGAFDVQLEVWLQTTHMRQNDGSVTCISRSSFAEAAYWTVAQCVTHHTVNGCSLSTGDLVGTGTLSGPSAGQEGSLLELTKGGKQPITLPNGEKRLFLEDGDTVTLRGYCTREGFRRIGFGACTATVLPKETHH